MTPLAGYLLLSALLFSVGLAGALTRRTLTASLAAALAYFAFQVVAQAIWGPALPAVHPPPGATALRVRPRRAGPSRRSRGSPTPRRVRCQLALAPRGRTLLRPHD